MDGARKKAKYLIDAEPQPNGTSWSPDPAPIVALAPRPEPQNNAPLLEQGISPVYVQTLGTTASNSSPADSIPAPQAGAEPPVLQATPSITNFGSEAINLEYAIMSNMLSYPVFSGPPTLNVPADGPVSTISIPSSLWAAPAALMPASTLQSPAASAFNGSGSMFGTSNTFNGAGSFDGTNSTFNGSGGAFNGTNSSFGGTNASMNGTSGSFNGTNSSFSGTDGTFNRADSAFNGTGRENHSGSANDSQATSTQPMRGRQMPWQGRSLAHAQDTARSSGSGILHRLSPAAAGAASRMSPPPAQMVADDAQHPLSRPPTSGPAVYGLNPVYPQSPADVYSSVSEPYAYHTGFHFFFKYISTRLGKRDVLRVSRAIAHFRPSLVALLRNLTREDLVFMEKSLRRALLEYEKLIGFVGTPTVVWRRTGEIALVGKEFSILTQWDRHELLAGNRFIFELMDAESAVVYWEQFAVHAFENSEHAVMTECRLVRPDGVVVPCAFSFTIKRDLFGIPMAIVGNFLPIL
ncbi:Transcriptional regulator of nonfermentable carbon utilization [Coemansia sp. RSA 564]|nr:Transcriptional regulator of nonfermentable carbon utilization [Coemansia sp. RSA 564]KAJ2409825.1 Transcriptional regulator of nonfermentable carbon utilization [Coemansia sp. RSA 2526]